MCVIPYGTQEGEISFCAYNTGVGWRNIIEEMRQVASTQDWFARRAGTRSTPATVRSRCRRPSSASCRSWPSRAERQRERRTATPTPTPGRRGAGLRHGLRLRALSHRSPAADGRLGHGPGLDAAARRPAVVERRELAHELGAGRGEVRELGPILGEVVELPGPAVDGDELPVAAAGGAVALVLPEERARLVRVAVEEVLPLQRARGNEAAASRVGSRSMTWPTRRLIVPARITPGQRAMKASRSRPRGRSS